jgi:uncharacterized protein (TIGR04255 family)
MTSLDQPIPERLKKEPLIEALWEIRFSNDKESVVELLPGLIYKVIGAAYPKIQRLPAGNLPPAILHQDANLRYVPTTRLIGDRYSIQIGEHVVSLSCPRPYTGWEKFQVKIRELAQVLKETDLLTGPERFSLKYVDVIPVSDTPSIEPLEVILKLGTHELSDRPVQLRTEIREDKFLHIVQIVSPAQVTLPTGEKFEGVLVDIDTICQHESGDFWLNFNELLGQAHGLGKKLFFRLLKANTIKRLDPEY